MSGVTAVEITVWFHLWMAYSSYGETFEAAVELDGRQFRATMDRIYGKLGSSKVQGVDSLRISTDASLPFPPGELDRAPVRTGAARSAEEAYKAVRAPIRTLAFRIVEHLRLERPDINLGLSADRRPHQPLGREHKVDVWIPNPPSHDLLFPLWTWEADEKEVDFDSLPLLEQGNFSRAVEAAAIADPEYSRVLRRDAQDHRRSGDLRVAIILAVTACETRFKEIALDAFDSGWSALLAQQSKPAFGYARAHEGLVFGATYEAHDSAANQAMTEAVQLRNDLIHNVLTAPEPSEAQVDAALAAVDAYWAWLDSL